MESDTINNPHWSQWQLLDSFLPTGGFAHSYGLEAAIQACFVVSLEDLQTYILNVLDNTGSLFLPFVCMATKFPDFETWLKLDRLLEATLTNEISRKASSSQGSALMRVAASVFQEIPSLKKIRETVLGSGNVFFHHATVFGLICGLLGFGSEFSQRAYIFVTMRDLLSAATRLNLIGPMGAAVLQHRMGGDAEKMLQRWMDRQTRKKMLAGNGSREHFCRQMPNVAVICERKVSELISSTKKKKLVEIHSRRHEQERELSAGRDLSEDVAGDISDDVSVACQDIQETIFSPSFFHSKHACGSIPAKVDFLDAFTEKDKEGHNEKFIEDKMQIEHMQEDHGNVNLVVNPSNHSNVGNINGDVLHIESLHVKSLCEDEFSAIGDLSPEVSAIYLAMQHSKLECVDEKSQDSISEEVSVETEDDDFDDFDPYLFIKDLPNLSVVVPKFRSMLLPKKTRSCPSTTLVLDLDETLVHSTLEPCGDADFAFPVNFNLKEHTIYVRCRPFLKDFIERVATLFETIIFTASQSIYAEQLLNMLDPKRKLFRHRVFRESCVYVEGNYLKDLSILGRDLAHVIIIDNSPQAFGFQLDNGIPIESWFDDHSDRELLSLVPFLETLVSADDVRPLIAKKFNLRKKVEAATPLPLDFRR